MEIYEIVFGLGIVVIGVLCGWFARKEWDDIKGDETTISGDTRNLAEPVTPVAKNRGMKGGRNTTRARGR
jgi:hypothetical protein